jgi:hypothetical protein
MFSSQYSQANSKQIELVEKKCDTKKMHRQQQYLLLNKKLYDDIARAKQETKSFLIPNHTPEQLCTWLTDISYALIKKFFPSEIETKPLKLALDFCDTFNYWKNTKEKSLFLLDTLIKIWHDAIKNNNTCWKRFFFSMAPCEALVLKLNSNPDKYHFIRVVGMLLMEFYFNNMLGNAVSERIAEQIQIAKLDILPDRMYFFKKLSLLQTEHYSVSNTI